MEKFIINVFNKIDINNDIGNLIELEYISIMWHGNDSYIPEFIYDLKNLKSFTINLYDFAHVNDERELTQLYVVNNFYIVSDRICNLKNLNSLEIKNTKIPECIYDLKKLKKLNIIGVYFHGLDRISSIKTINPKIKNLSNLIKLKISVTNITEIPSEIGELANLKILELNENKLSTIPKEIGNLKNLTELNLRKNQFSSLPKEILNLKNLTKLHLGGNKLRSLPIEIGSLKKLTELDLYGNDKLSSLPKEIFNLKNLDDNSWAGIGQQFFYVKKYKNAVLAFRKAIKKNSNYYSHFFSLSFYALFTNKPQEAITAAKKSLELAPKQTGVYTNLVLGYVLNNEFKKAKPIYLEWKDKHFPNDKRTCKEVFLQDIKDLEAAGIKHKDFDKVRKLLK